MAEEAITRRELREIIAEELEKAKPQKTEPIKPTGHTSVDEILNCPECYPKLVAKLKDSGFTMEDQEEEEEPEEEEEEEII